MRYFFLLTFFNCLLYSLGYSQNHTDSIVYDLDSLVYKVYDSNSDRVDYFDQNGFKREIVNIENIPTEELRIMSIMSKLVGRNIKVPSRYVHNTPIEDFDSRFTFEMSFLIEKNGKVSNLRLIGKIPSGYAPNEFFPRKFKLPKFQSIINSFGDTLLVEGTTEIVVECMCSPPIKE
ncbi:hypothetical protein [Flammeovirga kamogawensis]|uniref:Lipid/polyisoprenoid-binding YceI-like domain-containing protein n=1 Tax=Flammeovirga kamogawensis TaxID=373891 RepID=A0ABX8H1Y5_9BACT|nr:hypothetical protein [Flammeovirga kamogawensis]MBB6464121.1 hypothetical protein [Flammeovirga kamogawensis]QWG09913.1 hypothetical protein KM029_19725 [Flammeovirga kamogawensis]TRX65423.1 hypothetical protein EO216_23150 [Flammeovirga kamogawensis]